MTDYVCIQKTVNVQINALLELVELSWGCSE